MGRWGQKGEANSGVEKDRARATRMRRLEGALGVRARRGAGAGDRRRPARADGVPGGTAELSGRRGPQTVSHEGRQSCCTWRRPGTFVSLPKRDWQARTGRVWPRGAAQRVTWCQAGSRGRAATRRPSPTMSVCGQGAPRGSGASGQGARPAWATSQPQRTGPLEEGCEGTPREPGSTPTRGPGGLSLHGLSLQDEERPPD